MPASPAPERKQAPAPKRFPDRDDIERVRAEADRLEPGAEAPEARRLAGRVLARRDLGKLVFLDLVDRSGRIQLLCPLARTGEVDVHLGDVVGVTGHPTKSRRGEASLVVDELVLLSRIRSPLPDTFHGLTDVEQRYRRRYLDLLMNEDVRADFLLRARIVSATRRFLDQEGFVEVETPVLQPRYGGGFAEPFVTHSNELDTDLYLRIATELYLKRLIVGGLEKVYELGKDFRNEGVSYKHNPEFTQLEWYEAYADYRDTMDRMERLVEFVAKEAIGTTRVVFKGHEVDLKAPWKRVRLVDELATADLWTRDFDELKQRLAARGVEVSQDRTWAQLVDKAVTAYIEPRLIEPTILYDYPIELSPFARSTDDTSDHGAIRVLRWRHGARERVLGAERRRGTGGAVLDAGRGGGRRQPRGRAGRSGLRGGALVRDAADRRPRARHRPPRDGPGREGVDSRRHPLPRAARAALKNLSIPASTSHPKGRVR